MNNIILYSLFLFCVINGVLSSKHYCGLLLESLEGINKSVTFLKDHHSEIDFDGLYGFQLLENYLKTIPRFAVINACQEKTDEIYLKIENQTKTLSKIIKLSKSEVNKTDPEYYKKMIKVTTSFIKINTKYTFLQGDEEKITKLGNRNHNDYYNEESGDSCLKEITDNCTISYICYLNFVKSPIGEEYIATHQAIYLGLYIKNKCFLKNKRSLNIISLQEKLEKTCLKLKKYTDEILLNKTPITDISIDLFLEIIVVCGGQFRYLDFLSIMAFNSIQKFQNINGCFANNNFAQTIKRNFVNVIPQMDDFLVRKKRRNKSINGCDSHTLGLGAASFGAFLQRFLFTK